MPVVTLQSQFPGHLMALNSILKNRLTLNAVYQLQLRLLNRGHHVKSLALVQYLKIKAKLLKHIPLQALVCLYL